jgi:hypothetical protein
LPQASARAYIRARAHRTAGKVGRRDRAYNCHMHKFVRQHVAWIWIAALAVLFSALAPAISHALAASSRPAVLADEEVQVCTMEGMKTVAVDAPSRKFDPHRSGHFLEHCPYCALHANPALPPASAPLALAAPLAGAADAPLFHQSVFPLFAWTPSSPRGPPVSA